MTYYFYKFTGKVKLCQMLPGFFSRDFFFLFLDKNLLSFWGCEEIFYCSNLLSRKFPKLGRFFYKNILLVRAAFYTVFMAKMTALCYTGNSEFERIWGTCR